MELNNKQINGSFVISLDLELHWGIFDVKPVDAYRENLENTREAVSRIVELSNEYGIRLTFATVGFLFAENKKELLTFCPKERPTYSNPVRNPYSIFHLIGKNEKTDPFHYANSLIRTLKNYNNHEISTHTFSHYYCGEVGQTIQQFDEDLKAAKKIAENLDISIESIVFPRNQIISTYVNICSNHGITSFRGTENFAVYNSKSKLPRKMQKALRLLDSYLNIYGHHTYNYLDLINTSSNCLNLPSSRFLRPYNKKLAIFEPLKVNRIKRAMTLASKQKRLYHLWWHPHNFGMNLNENMKILETIFKHYNKLNNIYDFKSETMTSLQKVLTNN